MRRLGIPVRVLLLVVAVAALGLCARRFVVGTVRVAGTSMRDTLCAGDVALVTRLDYRLGAPGRGDVVECRFPGREDAYIKRVVGLPGERIACFGGALSVDGDVLPEGYVSSPTGDFEVRLGTDEYLLLGDNRADSYDSRMPDMGPVGAGDILGRVRFVLWPLSRFGPVR